jgi:crotonobetainyl-CoA:carnitine CoA-transferase CaiB-like acyl-CoA transferase
VPAADGGGAALPGYDLLAQAVSGLMSLTGDPDGPPYRAGVAVFDVITGLHAAVAVLAALQHRDRTGEGQHIDLALLDVQVACLANQAANHLVGGLVPRRLGNAHPNIVPYQDFPTADGHMIIAVGNDGQFAKLCATLGHREWADDERFATNPQRVKHRAVLIGLLRDATRTQSTAHWVAAMEAAGVPCGPINTIDQVFQDPQVQARGLRVEMPHPTAGTVPLVANPIRLSGTPVDYRRAPPTLGQHTDEVLAQWLQLEGDAVSALRQRQVV